MRKFSVFAFLMLASTTFAQAETLQLSGQQHWLAIASDKDKDVVADCVEQVMKVIERKKER